MSARTRLTPSEFADIQRRRRESAEAAMRGRAHRALPLDEVERRAQAARKAWPMSCNTGTPGECDCMPMAGASAVSGIEHEAPYSQRAMRKPAPPTYPWRQLFAGFAVTLAVIACVSVIAAFAPPPSVVATR